MRHALLCLILTAASIPAAAQPTKSTLSGVYTAEQAARGSDTYAMFCRSCHTPESHTGETFAKLWKGKTLSDLYSYINELMPKNDPGGLEATQYADVMAYMLKMNALPAGTTEIVPDTATLSLVRIDLKTAAAGRASGTKSTPSKTTIPVRKP